MIGLFSAQSVSATDTLVQTPFVQIHQDITANFRVQEMIMNENGIFILFYDQATFPNLELFFMKSTDEGSIWSTPLLIDTVDNNGQEPPNLAINGTNALSICHVERGVLNKVQCSISTDNGDSFVTQTASSEDFDGGDISWASDGNNILMTFTDAVEGVSQGVKVSNNFGVTWESSIIIVESEVGGQPVLEEFQLGNTAVHGMNMYVVFQYFDDDEGVNVVGFSKSNDDGATWSTVDPLLISAGDEVEQDQLEINLDENGGKIIVTFLNQSGEIIGSRSADGGTTFSKIFIDETVCDTPYKLSNQGDDVIFHCPLGGDASELKQTLSNDFGLTYGSFTNVTTGVTFNWNNEPLNLFVGDNVYHLFFDESGFDVNEPTFISYSQDRGLTYNTDFVVGTNSTRPNGSWNEHAFAFDDVFGWIRTTTDTIFDDTIEFWKGVLPNSASTSPDTTAPVIDTFLSEPISIRENSVFDFTDHVFCLDDIDGDITIGMSIIGDPLNIAMRGVQTETYSCTDVATNNSQLTVQYLVKKQSSSSGGGGSSAFDNIQPLALSGQQSEPPRLEDIQPITREPVVDDSPRFFERLFADLFQNRLGVDGERVDQGIETAQSAVATGQQAVQGFQNSQASNVLQQIFDRIFSFFR